MSDIINEMLNRYGDFVGDQSSKRTGYKFPKYMAHDEMQKANFFFGKKLYVCQ